MIARVSMLLKKRASPDMLPFSLCNKKRLGQTPLFNDTIDSVLRHREVGRGKDLSARPRNYGHNIVVVSIAIVVVITNTYFLQILPALLHQVGRS
jgi:hypothetical protein